MESGEVDTGQAAPLLEFIDAALDRVALFAYGGWQAEFGPMTPVSRDGAHGCLLEYASVVPDRHDDVLCAVQQDRCKALGEFLRREPAGR
ncbi:hypothetical protein GCM10018966_062610 [Streptomyces yanii]